MPLPRYNFFVGDEIDCNCRPLNGGRRGIGGIVVDIVIHHPNIEVYHVDLGGGLEERIGHPDCEPKIEGVNYTPGWRLVRAHHPE